MHYRIFCRIHKRSAPPSGHGRRPTSRSDHMHLFSSDSPRGCWMSRHRSSTRNFARIFKLVGAGFPVIACRSSRWTAETSSMDSGGRDPRRVPRRDNADCSISRVPISCLGPGSYRSLSGGPSGAGGGASSQLRTGSGGGATSGCDVLLGGGLIICPSPSIQVAAVCIPPEGGTGS
jgi:hypothetical protein